MLLMYPEVQAKAHAEFDTVIGHDRPPTIEDQLPYMEAVWKEVLRWHPPAPLSSCQLVCLNLRDSNQIPDIPHLSSQEDIWDEYHIPKGTVVYANIGSVWYLPCEDSSDMASRAMLRNPRVWDDPETFNPDRFLVNAKPGTFDPRSVVFGFGRRYVCDHCAILRGTPLILPADCAQGRPWQIGTGSIPSLRFFGRSILTRCRERTAQRLLLPDLSTLWPREYQDTLSFTCELSFQTPSLDHQSHFAAYLPLGLKR